MDFKDFSANEFATNGLFIRWVNGSDPSAAWFWDSFIKEHPHKLPEIEEAKRIVMALQFQEPTLSNEVVASMRNKLLIAIHEQKETERENFAPAPHTKPLFTPPLWMKWAAVLALPLLTGALVLLLNRNTVESNRQPIAKSRPAEKEQRVSPRGQKSLIQLADGTKVWLNADSRLDYKSDFNAQAKREVYLTGEAFFDVAHNASKPFIVHTSAITIHVLGTAFNVKSYGESPTIETTLVRGKVSINKEGSKEADGTVVLEPNQRAVFSKKANSINVEQVQAERISSWRSDKLIFDETPFYEVIPQLERWYDVKINVLDEARESLTCSLTAELENEKLIDVLSLLKASHGISYTVEGKEIFIRGKLCGN